MKKNPFGFVWKHNRVWLLVTSCVMAFLILVSILATSVTLFKNTLLTIFGEYRVGISNPYRDENYLADDGITDKATALAYANGVNERINEEGVVLLKNDGALPIKTPTSDSSVSVKPKVSVFGKNSVDLVYGGSGSGAMSSDSVINLYQSLAEAGFDYNPALYNFYSSSASGSGRPSAPPMGSELEGFAIGETPIASYTTAVRNSYSEYNAAAIVVLSRIGGEGYDLPRTMKNTSGASEDAHYLELDNNERAMLSEVCNSFDKVIVVINCAAPMELGFLNSGEFPAIKAAVWMGNPGGTGARALGRVLSGAVNPSGRLVDTYASDFTKSPTYANFGNNLTSNGHRYTVDGALTDAYFVDYEEGIYVGYRYYETRYITEPQETRDTWYSENVVYPFGYGLSYTDFKTELVSSDPSGSGVITKDGSIKVTVRVTNTGETAGKHTVQLYSTAPYYRGGIEKSHVTLVKFAKTDMLYPKDEAGEGKPNSQDIEITVAARDLASYDNFDANGNGYRGYELEAGNYVLSVRDNAHDEVAALSLTVNEQSAAAAGVNSDAARGKNGFTYSTDSATGNAVTNQFDDVSSHITTYLSRADMAGTMPKTATAEDREVTSEFITSLTSEAYIGSGRNVDRNKPWLVKERPAYASSEVSSDKIPQLYELRGKAYDDELWNALLDNLTLNQMAELIGTGNFNTAAISNITKPKTIDPDGPAGFTNFMAIGGAASVYDTCFYASECVIGATFNVELAAEMGNAIGNEALIGNARGGGRPYSGWYAPAVNIHRSEFSGRNFEYYSEDGLLSGKLGAALVESVQKKGVYTYVKHFALNDQETQRGGVCTWASEQAMREVYFKPFELIVKDGGTRAMMSSFNRIGTVWTGGSYELLTNVLRKEWGFVGMVITDYNTYDHMPADQMIRAGGDLNLYQDKKPSVKGGMVTASHLNAMRNATHNILYTVANSNAMNDIGEGSKIVSRLPIWMVIMIVVDCAAAAGFAVWGFFAVRGALKKERNKATVVVTEAKTE